MMRSEMQRRLVDLLRRHGVDQDVQLPQIAVAGDQSSGKSSVLSMLSGVEFPSGAELTTRCATELILHHHPKDTAIEVKVTLDREAKSLGGLDKLAVDCPPTTVDAMSKVAAVIAQFQASFAADLPPDEEISTHRIVVEASGPEQPDLTLIDLPGLVRTTTEGQNESILAKIRELVVRYLAQERTIILAVVPANQDVAGAEVLQLAKESDPHGVRTLGVVTKPDLVDRGAELQVVKLVRNEKKPLELGYQLVQCRSQRQVDEKISLADQREHEIKELLDDSEGSWQDLGIPVECLGTDQLTRRLTGLLEKQISAALPLVRVEVEKKLGETRRRIKELGATLEAPEARLERLLSIADRVATLVVQSLEGNYADQAFFDNGSPEGDAAQAPPGPRFACASLRMCEEKFHEAMQQVRFEQTLPKLPESAEIEYNLRNGNGSAKFEVVQCDAIAPWKPGMRYQFKDGKRGTIVGVCEYGDEKKKTHAVHNDGDNGACYYSKTPFPSSAVRIFDDPENSVVRAVRDQLGWHDYDPDFDAKESKSQHTVIASMIARTRGRELSNFNKFSVFQPLVRKKIDGGWLNPVETLTAEAERSITDATSECVDFVVAEYWPEKLRDSDAARAVRAAMKMCLVNSIEEWGRHVRKELEKLVDREQSPYTLNHYYSSTVARRKLEREVRKLLSATTPDSSDKIDASALLKLASTAHVANDDAAVIDLQDSLFAYWKCATKRVVDNVVMAIRHDLVSSFAQGSASLLRKLAIDPNLAEALKEGQREARIRAQLHRERERLQQAMQDFRKYDMQF